MRTISQTAVHLWDWCSQWWINFSPSTHTLQYCSLSHSHTQTYVVTHTHPEACFIQMKQYELSACGRRKRRLKTTRNEAQEKSAGCYSEVITDAVMQRRAVLLSEWWRACIYIMNKQHCKQTASGGTRQNRTITENGAVTCKWDLKGEDNTRKSGRQTYTNCMCLPASTHWFGGRRLPRCSDKPDHHNRQQHKDGLPGDTPPQRLC